MDQLTIDSWMNFYMIPAGTPAPFLKRYLVADPRLGAARYFQKHPSAALHAPAVILVIGQEDGSGSVVYELPSAGISMGAETGELKSTSLKLDGLIEALVRKVTDGNV